MSVLIVGSISTRSISLASLKKTPQIKEDDIFLNGKKVRFSKDFAKTARAINRLSRLGIKAEIVTLKNGKERLILRVRSGALDIKDPKGVLATLYKQGQIGKTQDKTIQIIRSGRGSVNLKYSATPIKTPLVKGLRLKPAHIIHFAEKHLPMQEIERGVLPEVRENQEIPEIRLEEVGAQQHNVPKVEKEALAEVEKVEINLEEALAEEYNKPLLPLSVANVQNFAEEALPAVEDAPPLEKNKAAIVDNAPLELLASIDQEKFQLYANSVLHKQRIEQALQVERETNSELNADRVVDALREKMRSIMGSLSDLESEWIKDVISTELIQSDLDATFLRKRVDQISDAIYQNIHSKRSFLNKAFSNLGITSEQIEQATQETIILLKTEQEKFRYI